MTHLVRLESDFEGKPLVTLTHDGRLAWVARQVGAALGYANRGKRLVNKITSDWADEFIAGRDYAMLSGEELAAFKAAAQGGPVPVSSRANNSLLILFESGLHLVLAKTTKPVGKRLRRFLVDEVLPQVARDGRFDPNRAVVDGQLVVVTTTEQTCSPMDRERRLAAKLELDDRKFRSRSLRDAVGALHAMGQIDDTLRATYEVSAAEIALGRDLPALRPFVEDHWQSPTDIAKRLGVSVQKVGRVITKLDLRGDKPGLARPILNKARGSQRTVITYLYAPEAVVQIEATIRGAR